MLVIDNDRFTHVHAGRFKKRPIRHANVLDQDHAQGATHLKTDRFHAENFSDWRLRQISDVL